MSRVWRVRLREPMLFSVFCRLRMNRLRRADPCRADVDAEGAVGLGFLVVAVAGLAEVVVGLVAAVAAGPGAVVVMAVEEFPAALAADRSILRTVPEPIRLRAIPVATPCLSTMPLHWKTRLRACANGTHCIFICRKRRRRNLNMTCG